MRVTVPSFRDGDVRREADLIEEVARVHGLDRLPTTLPARRGAIGRLTPEQRLRRRLEDALRDRGLFEAISYSFTAPATLARLRLDDPGVVRVANPLSEEHSVMRPLLLPGLLDTAARNAAHGRRALALFESAHVYKAGAAIDARPDASPGGATPAEERHHIAAVLTEASPATWRSPAKPADFFAAKGLVEALLAVGRIDFHVEPAERRFLHPRRQASVVADGRSLGFVGEIHPTVADEWDLETLACLELDFDAIAEIAPTTAPFRPLSTYPAVAQDIAVVVPEDVPFADVEAAVQKAASDTLAAVKLFDVYRGEQVGAGNKSLALRLEFRSLERTLTDDEIAKERARITDALREIGGSLRA